MHYVALLRLSQSAFLGGREGRTTESSSFAIRGYHGGEAYFVSWYVVGRSIGLSKKAERAERFGTREAASAALDQIDRLRGIATVVEVARPYSGVRLIASYPDEVILGWHRPREIRTRARVKYAAASDCGDVLRQRKVGGGGGRHPAHHDPRTQARVGQVLILTRREIEELLDEALSEMAGEDGGDLP